MTKEQRHNIWMKDCNLTRESCFKDTENLTRQYTQYTHTQTHKLQEAERLM